MLTIRALYPGFNDGQGVAYSCRSICEHLQADSVRVETWFPASDSAARPSFGRDACPRLLLPFVYRLPDAGRRLARTAERSFVRALRPNDIAYLWPGVSVETYQRIKDRGHTIVSEQINCHPEFAKRLLDEEYKRIGWPASHAISDEDVELEQRRTALADFIYAPNPFVVRALQEAGIADEKIVPVSYGWSPQRVAGIERVVPPAEGLNVLFVGRLCIRKGIHLLLEAWEKADIKGRLLFAGAVHHDIAERLAGSLARTDVIQLGHTLDIGAVYRSADVFAFGSLEEGGPMVTYEAMGCGLPVIVSPMGAGPARDSIDGFVLDPHDINAWVVALRRFAEDSDLRKQMGQAARKRAQQFTWEKVGARRRELLQAAINSDAREEVAV